VQSPLFSVVVPPGNLLGVPVVPGKDQRVAGVTDGYFFILPPLPVGKHVFLSHVNGVTSDPIKKTPFKSVITVNLIIQNPNDPLPLISSGGGGKPHPWTDDGSPVSRERLGASLVPRRSVFPSWLHPGDLELIEEVGLPGVAEEAVLALVLVERLR